MKLCDYGCGKEGRHQFKNGKWCCSEFHSSCPAMKKQNSRKVKENAPWKGKKLSTQHKLNLSKAHKGITTWIKGKSHTEETKLKMKNNHVGMTGKNHSADTKYKIGASHKGKILSDDHRSKLSESHIGKEPWNKGKKLYDLRRSIQDINKKYPLFSKIEEMRYNPNKEYKEIQVHCKNHNCPNSKEQGGWFTPNRRQIERRLYELEKNGLDNGYFYCSENCKVECPLYNLKSDPFKNTEVFYTSSEYQQFREYVLERDDYKCQYCGDSAEHVHHERPQKLEPFFSLDPDLTWSVCEECHYKYGHKDECSTGNLAYTYNIC